MRSGLTVEDVAAFRRVFRAETQGDDYTRVHRVMGEMRWEEMTWAKLDEILANVDTCP